MRGEKYKIVLVTRENSHYGGLILEESKRIGLDIDLVIQQKWGKKNKIRKIKYYSKNYGVTSLLFSKLIENIDKMLLSKIKTPPKIDEIIKKYKFVSKIVPSLNGKNMLEILRSEEPDVILLGGVGIVSEKFIKCAKKCVINSHPGLVPSYRGSYVVRWAIHNNDPIGVTTHLVDIGIDSGDTLGIHKVNIPDSKSLLDIEQFVDTLRAKFLVLDTKNFLENKIFPQRQNQGHSYRPYSLMPPRKLLSTYHNIFRS